MFNGIKKLATKKVLIPLVILEMLFLIAGTAIKIIAFDGIYMDYFPDIRLGTLFTNIFNAIPVIILLLATIFFHSPKADLLFKISLIASVSISIAISLFDLIAPDVLGFVIMGVGKNIIGTLILSVPIIFIVVDCFQKHKYITASCWVAIIMLGLQIFSIFADWVMGSLYGHFTLCFALKSVIHWLIILIYLSQHITKRKMEQKASPVSIEGQLQIIKQKYENGEITQEEYREQKAELLKRI